MREKEIAEIRRRFKNDKNNINAITGCYVDSSGQILSKFKQSTAFMDSEEKEKVFTILRKTLTGTHGKNLIDIEFSTQQVVRSDEHSLLMRLRDSKLEDEESVQQLFEKIIESYISEQAYLILIALDTYDVPHKSKDLLDGGDFDSTDMFTYAVCSVCPIKTTVSSLGFSVVENNFYSSSVDFMVGAPVLGFMFPSFDDRSSNIYSALHFSKDIQGKNELFVQNVFNVELPMPPQQQKDTFNDIMENSLEETCSYDIVESVYSKVSEMVLLHKEAKEEEPLLLGKKEFTSILHDCDVPEENVQIFENNFTEKFGQDTLVPPKNIVEVGKFNVKTNDVTVNVNSDRTDLLKTQVIGGVKYLMIRLEDSVEVNGIQLSDIT